MHHRRRNGNKHKFALSTQTKIAMSNRQVIAGTSYVTSKQIITDLAVAALNNAAKNDAAFVNKEATAAMS